jgi:hypothetical protein
MDTADRAFRGRARARSRIARESDDHRGPDHGGTVHHRVAVHHGHNGIAFPDHGIAFPDHRSAADHRPLRQGSAIARSGAGAKRISFRRT